MARIQGIFIEKQILPYATWAKELEVLILPEPNGRDQKGEDDRRNRNTETDKTECQRLFLMQLVGDNGRNDRQYERNEQWTRKDNKIEIAGNVPQLPQPQKVEQKERQRHQPVQNRENNVRNKQTLVFLHVRPSTT